MFCALIADPSGAAVVYEDELVFAFLDKAPVFPGHVLLVPKVHFATLTDLPTELIGPLFTTAQSLAAAVQTGLDAHGSWVSMNNTVSQSVPHLHVHVIPRRRKDGLKGFYWPRQKYASFDEMLATAATIRAAVPADPAMTAIPAVSAPVVPSSPS